MDRSRLVCAEWKAAAGGTAGELEGYMSVFNTLDQDGDVVVPGAFRKSFADWSHAKAPMPLIADHQLSTDGVIGSVTHMAEDGYGAKIRARFSSTQKAQDIRTNMLEGHLGGLSYTYAVLRSHPGTFEGKAARFLDELRVFEATVSPFPVNQLALASAKAISNRPWSEFTEADYTPEQWRAACIVDTGAGDPGTKSRYKVPVKEPSGTLNRNGVHAAAGGHGLGAVQGISAEVRAAAARALLRYYGEIGDPPPDSLRAMAGKALDFDTLEAVLIKAFEIPDPSIRKAVVDLALPRYHPEQIAAGPADEPPTADAAADTGDDTPAAGTAEPDAAAYAVSIINPPGPRDDAPADSRQVLESLDVQADLDALEAQINQALGRTNA